MARIILLLCFSFFFLNLPVQAETSIQHSFHRSYDYEKDKNYSGAIRSLMRMYQLYPSGYTLNLRLGWLHYLNQSYEKALPFYAAAIQTAPYSIEAKLGRAQVLITQKKWDLAERQLKGTLKIDFYHPSANLKLLFVLRMKKNFDLALQVNQKMLLYYPTDLSFLTELGRLYWAQENWNAATAAFQNILTLDPENLVANSYFTPKVE